MSHTTLQPLWEQVSQRINSLRTELQSLLTKADDSSFSTVMGPACQKAGKGTPSQMQQVIKADPAINEGMVADNSKRSAARKAIRVSIEGYCDRAATGTFAAAATEFNRVLTKPVQSGILDAMRLLTQVEKDAEQLKQAAMRASGAGKLSAERQQAQTKYNAGTKAVKEASIKLAHFAKLSDEKSEAIELMMNPASSVALDADKLTELQGARDALDKERKHVERGLIQEFSDGFSGSFQNDTHKAQSLILPSNLTQDKSEELAQAVRIYLKHHVREYYTIIPEVFRVLDDFDTKLGVRYKPPNKADNYSTIDTSYRFKYDQQCGTFYDCVWKLLPAEVKAKLKATTNYGVDDQETLRIETKDGVSVIFGLLTVYKPVGMAYRDELVCTLEAAAKRFSNGAAPDKVVSELRETLVKAMELGVKLQWSKVGTPVVTVLTERSNNFSIRLAKYQQAGGIVDPDDCGVELEQMYTDVEQACKDMRNAGMDLKRIAGHINQIRTKGADKEWPDCRFGDKCTRSDCKFKHKDGLSSKKRAKANLAAAKKGADNKRKAVSIKTICKAKGCQVDSEGWRFCKACHRKGIENGSITTKAGKEWKPQAKAEEGGKRIAQLEAKVAVLEGQTATDGEDVELFGESDGDENVNDITYPGAGGPKSRKKQRTRLNVVRHANTGHIEILRRP